MAFPFFSHKTLLGRTLGPIAVVVILVLVSTTALISRGVYTNAVETLKNKADLTVKTMSDAAVTPVWDVSTKEAHKLLRAIAPDPDFVRGLIYLEDNSLFAHYEGVPAREDETLVFSAPIIRKTRNGTFELGRLELTYSLREAREQSLHTLYQLMVACSLLFAFLITTLYLILRAVTRPIVQMTKAMDALSHGHLDTEIPRTTLGGELAAMANAMSVFKNNAVELYQLIDEQKKLRIAAEKDARVSLFLKQIAAAANRAVRVEDMLSIYLATACKLFQWPIGHVYLADYDRNTLRSLKIWYLQKTHKYEAFKKATEQSLFTPESGLPGQCWARQTPIWVEDSRMVKDSPRLNMLQPAEPFAGVAMPVFVHGKVLYVIELVADGVRPIDRDLFTALTEASSYLTMALERKEKEKQLLQATVLAETTAQADMEQSSEQAMQAPMHSVLAMLSLVLDTELSETQRNRSDVTRQSVESLVGLINDILDLTPVESGPFLVEKTTFNLHALIENTSRLYHSRAQQKGLAILLDLPPSVPIHVKGDFLCIRQIFLNILDNAIKFTVEGYILIEVALKEEDGGLYIYISITDTGLCFTPEHINELIDTDNQQPSSDGTVLGSAGLGLSVSKRLCQLIHGQLGYKRPLHSGSTVWFKAPVHLEQESAADPFYRLAPQPLRQHKILILEPYSIDRERAAWSLAKWGIDAVYTDEARRFIRLLAAKRQELTAVICPTNGIEGDVLNSLQSMVSDGRKAPWIGLLQPLGQTNAIPPQLHGKVSFLLAPPLCQPSLHRILHYLDAYYMEGIPASPVSLQTLGPTATTPRTQASKPPEQLPCALVVDDQSFNLILMDSLLSRYGCKVELVADAKSALEKLKHKTYDIIFMDCQMPEVDGYEATAAIRKLEEGRGKRTPIIAFTANTGHGDREKCLAYGMDDYIPKPINSEKVLEALRIHLNLKTDTQS